MTEEELRMSQKKDWQNYLANREATRTRLYNDQLDLLMGCSFITYRGQKMIRELLLEQAQAWRQNDKDERDALRHAHQSEWEALNKRWEGRQRTERDR